MKAPTIERHRLEKTILIQTLGQLGDVGNVFAKLLADDQFAGILEITQQREFALPTLEHRRICPGFSPTEANDAFRSLGPEPRRLEDHRVRRHQSQHYGLTARQQFLECQSLVGRLFPVVGTYPAV